MNMIKNFFGFFFGFKGRIGRLHYVIFLLFFTILTPIIATLSMAFGDLSYRILIQGTEDIIYGLLTIGLLLITIIFYFTLKYSHLVRRVNDFYKKSQESNLFNAILWIDVLSFFTLLIGSDIKIFINLIMAIISIICMISLAFIKGDTEENKFGKPQIPFWKKRNS